MCKITFLRHGEVLSGLSWNQLEKINMMEDNVSLSDNGIKQATQFAKSLSPNDFDVIVVADSLRTRQTAEIISRHIAKPIIIEPLLNAWQPSKSLSFVSFNDYWNAYENFISCNGIAISSDVDWETYEELKVRTLKGIKKYEHYDSILIISHSIIISLYTGISRDGIQYCCPKTISYIHCAPPDFISINN